MKQHITIDQWQELSLKKQRKFQEVSKTGGLPTIGRMIEFLAQGRQSYWLPGCTIGESEINPETWCDELWKEVKRVLE